MAVRLGIGIMLAAGLLGGCQTERPLGDARVQPRAGERSAPKLTVASPNSQPVFEAQLFADGVVGAALPVSIGLETVGGMTAVLLPRGAPLPAERAEVFSTAVDNQPSVEITVVMGESNRAADNRIVGRVTIGEMPPAPAGVPQVEVSFGMDPRGVLTVRAHDRSSRTAREVRLESVAQPATMEEVQRLSASAASPAALSDQEVARTRLFADDVETDRLALSIGMETLRGESTIVLPQGTSLPARFEEVFSTGADNQPTVEVHVVQGERTLAADNLTLGRFVLGPIPPAPRGVPKIQVTLEVDATGELSVSARDLGTGRQHSIDLLGNPDHFALGKQHVDRMRQDARANQAGDRILRQRLARMLALDNLCAQTDAMLADPGVRLSQHSRSELADHLAAARGASMRSPTEIDDADLERVFGRLEQAAHAATRALYGQH